MIQQKFSFPEFARHLFAEDVAMATTDPNALMPRLIGDEVLALEQVSTARARQFGAGRAAARAAMEQLGQPPRPVLQGEDGAPIWPVGLTGSITHGEAISFAVVSDAPDLAALGVDLEAATALESALWPELCVMSEINWLARLGPSQRGHFAKLILCAKQAVYKAQFPLSRVALDTQAIALEIDLAESRFTASFTRPLPGFAPDEVLAGRFAILSTNVIAAVEIRR